MKLNYHPADDRLMVRLSEGESATARVLSPGIVADFDAMGTIIGLDITLENGVLSGTGLETIALLSAEA